MLRFQDGTETSTEYSHACSKVAATQVTCQVPASFSLQGYLLISLVEKISATEYLQISDSVLL